MKRQYFGTDGIRGRFGEEPITPLFMQRLGVALGHVLSRKYPSVKVIIGRDTRESGEILQEAFALGLHEAKVACCTAGIVPTPAVAYLTKSLGAQAGAVISASHNPYEDNGIKFFCEKGFKLPDDVEIAIEEALASISEKDLSQGNKEVLPCEGAEEAYLSFCRSILPENFSLKNKKIVLDCANGATYKIAPLLLNALNAEVIEMGASPNGKNINEACGSTNPQYIQKAVLENQADIIDAGRLAPSGNNAQPWRFRVLKDQESIVLLEKNKIAIQDFVYSAPLIIVCCADPSAFVKANKTGIL